MIDYQTAEALSASIEHWHRLITLFDSHDKRGLKTEGWAALSCRLCSLFYYQQFSDDGHDCVGCPVMRFSGRSLCRNTPYFFAATSLYRATLFSEFTNHNKDAIENEYKFLIDIMPAAGSVKDLD